MLFLITVTLLVASTQAMFYTDCGSKATIQNVGVSNCKKDDTVCTLKRGTNATISIDFTPSMAVEKLNTEVHGILMNLPVPFPLSNPNACKDNGLTCPLKSGDEANYKTTLPVLKSYPKLQVEIKWELKNEKDEDVVCVMISARLH